MGKQQACIVGGQFISDHTPNIHDLVQLLHVRGIESQVFYEVEADPTTSTIRKSAAVWQSFQPNLIIAIGGGSPMDAANVGTL